MRGDREDTWVPGRGAEDKPSADQRKTGALVCYDLAAAQTQCAAERSPGPL